MAGLPEIGVATRAAQIRFESAILQIRGTSQSPYRIYNIGNNRPVELLIGDAIGYEAQCVRYNSTVRGYLNCSCAQATWIKKADGDTDVSKCLPKLPTR
jgi:hypothetical protein